MRKLYDRIAQHPQVVRQPLVLRQFVKFSVVGGLNTILDFGLYFIFTREFEWYFVAASALSFSFAATNSYLLNRLWTFRDRSTDVPLQFAKFFLVALIGLGLNTGTLYALVNFVSLHDIPAKIVAIGVVVFWNFLVNKFWVFARIRQQTS